MGRGLGLSCKFKTFAGYGQGVWPCSGPSQANTDSIFPKMGTAINPGSDK